jgi:hypothetical protein
VISQAARNSGDEQLSPISNIKSERSLTQLLFGTDSDQNRMFEEIPRSGADSLPLIKPLRRTRTLCDQTQTQV